MFVKFIIYHQLMHNQLKTLANPLYELAQPPQNKDNSIHLNTAPAGTTQAHTNR
jgi:hypothetical protein